jgi:DNA invertase Pin-like site-specific DNA recombinase
MASEPKPLHCAVYTRKSTEHGLELEFNSLDAQRDACEAYIKSQSSLGWRALPQHYDDPAFSGGNLDRPALKKLLTDIEAGTVDIVVVYKIDRLTRSLADFARLVEAFDARSISFVAVTQQFNTTTSMGRLTLNVLLSFAQFERELSSERVRDKVAASRRKGKWTGGTVPLGYDAVNKKLVVNKVEAETVRTIFRLYLELKSFSRLVAELYRRSIVTKRRDTKVAKYNGGIPFTYGPLAYFLKNRIYIGEVHHSGKWFEGEHEAIVDRLAFERIQDLLKSNTNGRRTNSSKSGALLQGRLYDDRDNLMTPSFSSKNGVRYRFYVSTALRGRKDKAGSIRRISAPEIEAIVEVGVREQLKTPNGGPTRESIFARIGRVVVKANAIAVTARIDDDNPVSRTFELPWATREKSGLAGIEPTPNGKPDQKLLQSVVRAHAWLNELSRGTHTSIESLATVVKLHPKVIRQALRLAFLAPEITESILQGEQPAHLSLATIPFALSLAWAKQHQTLNATR